MEANVLAGSDEIILPSGTYTLSIGGAGEDAAGTGDLDITDDLTINGAGADTTFIDGADLDRVFHVLSGSTVEISSVTIRNGTLSLEPSRIANAEWGGGIRNDGSLTLTTSTISGNTAGHGGGIENSGTLTLTASTVSGNTARIGGGIKNSATPSGNSATTINNSTISDNSASLRGGGIHSNGEVDITNSAITGNSAPDDGGGIHNSGTLNLTASTVGDNISGRHGGGIYNGAGTVALTTSTVSGNSASNTRGSGGGIHNEMGTVALTTTTVSSNTAGTGGGISNDGVLTITNSTISGNTAAGGGGGIRASGKLTVTNSTISSNTAAGGGGIFTNGALTITNVTLSNNTAVPGPSEDLGPFAGGGIFISGGPVDLANTIISGNTAPTDSDCTGSPTSRGHNLIGNNSGCNFNHTTGDLVGTVDNPINALLGPLQDNGGPTFTHALLPGSPAFDAGGDSPAPPTDQRGVARPQCASSDIGAYELEPSGNCFPAALNQTVNTQKGMAVVITLKGSDGDTEDILSFIITSLPGSGDLSEGSLTITTTPYVLTRDMVTYTPNSGFTSTDSFTFKINDGMADGDVATVLVTVPATILTVSSTSDARDANPGDGDCDDGAGNCTLRAAIMEANALVGADTVTLPTGTYQLTMGGRDDAAHAGDLDITDDLTINGAGADTTFIDGGGIDRVFDVKLGSTLEISGVTVQSGRSDWGGGILNEGTLTLTDSTKRDNIALTGGGVYNNGNLNVINSTISGNTTNSGGGGIRNDGTVTLTDSTIRDNTAPAGGGIQNTNRGTLTITNGTVSGNLAGVYGGGIQNSGTLTITNSTVSANSGTDAGGISNTGTLTLINSTVSGNAADQGGGIKNTVLDCGPEMCPPGVTTMVNTIIAGNTATGSPDCDELTSLGHNVIGRSSGCSFSPTTGDLVDVDPKLGLLADNGGPTFTYALLPDSPAIDAGDDGAAPARDQRGVPRSQGAASDIGAFESGGSVPTPSSTPAATTSPTPTIVPAPTPTASLPPTPTSVPAPTATPNPTPTPTPVPTSTTTPKATPTATAAAKPTLLPSSTPAPEPTPTPTPTPTGGGGCTAPADGARSLEVSWLLLGLVLPGLALAGLRRRKS